MKNKIHPVFYENAKVTCSCGYSFTTGSTQPQIFVEVCYKCHPFYTGEKRYIDTLGQVEKFQKKQKIAEEFEKKKISKKQKNKEEKQPPRPKTLKELLAEI